MLLVRCMQAAFMSVLKCHGDMLQLVLESLQVSTKFACCTFGLFGLQDFKTDICNTV